MREALGGALAIVPSAKKIGGIGSRLDIPITHINASYVRSHFDAMEVYVRDAPDAVILQCLIHPPFRLELIDMVKLLCTMGQWI